MLKFTGKARPNPYIDQTHSTIGFWTDNGGYYHYATGQKNKSYDEVLSFAILDNIALELPFSIRF